MSNTEFTPGPWEALRKVYGPQKGLYVKQIGDTGLFLVKHTFDGLEAEANAKLMAAAPYMHEALGEVIAVLETLHHMNPEEPCSIYDAWNKAKRAIAKAGG